MNEKSHVWYAIPSARPAAEVNKCLDLWSGMGYRVAVLRDRGAEPVDADLLVTGEYPGYARAVNGLAAMVLRFDPLCNFVVTGGDDMHPDPVASPEVIESECLQYFAKSTYGIMQPTGDRWMTDKSGRAASERICGSPWMGREFIERMNGGRGPFWPEYDHYYCDEELYEVSSKLLRLWQRPELTHYHNHWHRADNAQRPPHLVKAESNWDQSKRLFEYRKAKRFPGHEPHSEREIGR